jgi:tetratricopeptide (TPR) repeat protein
VSGPPADAKASAPLAGDRSLNDSLRGMFEQAKRHFVAHEYALARTLLEQICTLHQGYADVYHMLGVVLHDAGLFSQAQSAFERALQLNPRYTEAALNLSVLYNDMGKYSEAKEVYGRALAYCRAEDNGLDPFVSGKIANMHAELADAYHNVGLLTPACEQFRQALALRPQFADLRVRLAMLLLEQQSAADAMVELQRALSDRPQYLPARIQLGVCCYALGNRDEAAGHWRMALEQDPHNAAAAMYLRMISASYMTPGASNA